MIVGGMVDELISCYLIKCIYMVVYLMGKLVVIYYCIMEYFCVYMCLWLCLEIGCMYQICVYMVYIIYLLVGDLVYGGCLCLLKGVLEVFIFMLCKFDCQVLYVIMLCFYYLIFGIEMEWYVFIL